MMGARRVLVGLAALGLLSACAAENDCGVADAMQAVNQIEIGSTRYYLYLKTTGVSDKASFLVLYDHEPSFDACGRADQAAVSEAYVEPDRGRPARVVYKGKELEVQYAEDAAGATDPQKIEIVVPRGD